MIRFDIITIFPQIFESYLKESIIKKALDKKLIRVKIHNLRKWTKDKHQTADDRPYGGGLGMIMKVEPIYRAVKEIRGRSKKIKVILFTPRGKQFNQKTSYQLSKLNKIIMLCGRYEGVDERVAKHIADMSLSIGPYDLMGGELAAMIVLESVARLIPGVLGKKRILKERITQKKGFIEYPQYTRPEIFEPKPGLKWKVPRVLLSGHHKKIEEWRKKHQKTIEK